MKCSELKYGAQVVFKNYSDILKREYYEIGTVISVDSVQKIVHVSWMEGYKERYSVVLFKDMVAEVEGTTMMKLYKFTDSNGRVIYKEEKMLSIIAPGIRVDITDENGFDIGKRVLYDMMKRIETKDRKDVISIHENNDIKMCVSFEEIDGDGKFYISSKRTYYNMIDAYETVLNEMCFMTI